MSRVKRGVIKHRAHKATLNMAKGYFLGRHRLYRKAHEQVFKSLAYAYAHRRERRGDMRRLWITRINAAARAQGGGGLGVLRGGEARVSEPEANRQGVNDGAAFRPSAADPKCGALTRRRYKGKGRVRPSRARAWAG